MTSRRPTSSHTPTDNTQQPDMSENFRNFSSLPPEIRSMIWEYSLPDPRIYEVLDAPNAKQKTPAQDGLMFANVHPEPPPPLAAVCRESRYFVLRHYKPLRLGRTTKFVDLSRDILLLEPYLLVKRLHRTLHFMGQIPLVRDNINRLALGTSYGVYTGICHPVLSWKVSKNNMGKLLGALAKFTRLKMLIFVVHQEFQFEFDFRYPATYPLAAPAPLPMPGGSGSGGSGSSSSSSSSHYGSPMSNGSPTPRLNQSVPSPIPTTLPSPAAMPPSSPSSPSPPMPLIRPQIVHQAYRFKFDIEANINCHPRRPHLNELLYYPLEVEEDKDDWDALIASGLGKGSLSGEDDESEWCDPWPTNDDWRRFRRRFQRGILVSLENGLAEGYTRAMLPSIKGASLLWRYTRGGCV